MLYTFLLVVHAIIAAALVGVILVQRSEGGGLGVGGSPTGLMSARGAADFLTRATGILAAVFIVMSIGLAALATVERGTREIDTSLARRPAPAAPGSDVPLASPAPGVGAPAAAPAAEGVPGLPVLPAGTDTTNAERAEKARAAEAAAPAVTEAPRRERRRRTEPTSSDAAAPAAESKAPAAGSAPAPAPAPSNAPPANDTPAPAAE